MTELTTLDILMLAVQCLLALVAFFGAIVGNNLIAAIKDLREADKELANKLDLYARKDDMVDIKKQLGGIFERLEDIKDRVSTKVGREEMISTILQLNNHGG